MVNINQSPLAKAIRFFFILFLLITPVVWVSLSFTNFNGDLTRIGKLAERDFNWTQTQPNISSDFMKSSAIADADILVIGDSFSAPLIWQASLVKQQLKVATLAWTDVGYVCEDFSQTIRKAGFKGTTVIFEMVERGAEARFSTSSACTNTLPIVKSSVYQGGGAGGNSVINYSLNLKGKFLVGLNTIVNSILLRANFDYLNFYNEIEKGAHLYSITDGCKYFSNYLCELGLFYYEDYEREILGQKTIKDIRAINSKNADKSLRFIWVVVPNKSSIYHRQVSADFWTKLNEDGLGPDLYRSINEGKSKLKDLYDPNGSHFSSGGYELMGEVIFKFLKAH